MLAQGICKRIYSEQASRELVQLDVLKHVHEANPNGRWVIKADGCDVHKGSRESVRHKWSGDVDLGDGSLQRLYSAYLERRKYVEGLGLGDRKESLLEDLKRLEEELIDDQEFLTDGEKTSSELYNKKLDQGNVKEDKLFALGWDVEGLFCFHRSTSSRIHDIRHARMVFIKDRVI